jgi:acetyl esterase/lipase
MMAPSRSPAVLAKFPPTLLITGTRAGEMGAATRSHIDLVKVGVDARLFLWDGLDHGFMNNPELPESREAYEVIIRFFREQMDTAGRSAAARR